MALAATMLGTSGRSEGDVLRQIQEKTIEEVMVSRKANSVLSNSSAGFPMAGPADSSFIERRPQKEMSAAEAAASYREYLGQSMGSGMVGSNNGMSDTQLQEDYNEMRERCLLLTQRLMEMEQVAHRLEAQRDEILNRKEKTVQLQTVIADCSVNLENLDRIFNVEDKETQDDAATVINALVRGFIVRRRIENGKAALYRWKTQQVVWLKTATMRFLAVQRAMDHTVSEMRYRRTGAMLTEIVQCWRIRTLERLPQRQRYRHKYELIRKRHVAAVLRKIMLAWCATATGKYSRKAVKRAYEQRKRKAELRLITQAEESGFEGDITEEMVVAELETEAVDIISSKHYATTLESGVLNWRDQKQVKVGRNHYKKRWLGIVISAWCRVTPALGGDAGDEDWVQKHQMRVKMRIFFRALQEDVLLEWHHVAHTRQEAARRAMRIAKQWIKIVWKEFRDTCLQNHHNRRKVVDRMRKVMRALIAVPFSAWRVWTVETIVWKDAVVVYTKQGDRYRNRHFVRENFNAWKEVIFKASANDQAQLLETIRQLQSANEELKIENEKAVSQAENAVTVGEGQLLEKERRAEKAETEAQALALQLQATKEKMLAMEQAAQQQEALAAARAQIGSAGKQKPTREPTPEVAPVPAPQPKADGTKTEVSYDELMLLNRAKWAIEEFDKPAAYTPPPVDGTEQDAELRRLNTIIEVFMSAERKQPANPNGVKLPPVKPPSRQAVTPAQNELQWDEFLTGLDEFDQGRRNSISSSSSSRPGSKQSSRPGSRK